jgi:hypothetical protein
MPGLPNSERVKIWNSLLCLAHSQKERLRTGPPLLHSGPALHPKGGRLSPEQEAVVGLLTFCTLALEARANHLIEELYEKGRISDPEARAAQRLTPEHKWFLLPHLAGRRKSLVSRFGNHVNSALLF